jgi:branched-chain amino acid transport system ATP-binding protein
MSLLELRDVHTHIAGFHILDGVSFVAEEGKLTILLGRNGAGKSTTIRTIMGLTPSSAGEIVFRGERIQARPAHEIPWFGISLVPENRDVFSRLTVEENLVLAVRTNRREWRRRFDYVARIFPPMRGLLGKKGGHLSGGEKQMVAVSRALMNDDRLLLIDEPTKGLAPIMVESMRLALAEVKKRATVLLVEQNFEFASSIADHFLIMEHGKVVCSGAIDELLRDEVTQRRYMGV